MAKILLADDDPFLLKIYSTKLTQDGHEVILCADGQCALDDAIAKRPDVIVLDIMLPRLNGLDVLDELKKDKKLKDTPVICLSNLSQPEEQAVAMEKGATEFLVKVRMTPSEIIAVLQKYLPT